MARTRRVLSSRSQEPASAQASAETSLGEFACPNEDCCDFNRFGEGNLSVSDWIGKGRRIRRLYCSTCKKRFSERKGSLLEHAKTPAETVVRIVKCLGHGCSVEATADICEVDCRTVERYVAHAGRRAEDFHQLQLERLKQPPPAVEMDELHARVSRPPREKKGAPTKSPRVKKRKRREMGRNWVHVALAAVSRFVIDLRVGPRTKEIAVQLVASVALCGASASGTPPLFLVDDHLPYPSALLEVYGDVQHRRRRGGRGRRKHPRLKPPPGLRAGVVKKVRDANGNLIEVKTRGLFGSKKAVIERVQELEIGETINTSHVERLNGTLRGQQARLNRRTRAISRRKRFLNWSLQLWRDLYNWTRTHRSLKKTPAMAEGLADHAWSVQDYIRYPVHVSPLMRDIWEEERQKVATSALESEKTHKTVPTS